MAVRHGRKTINQRVLSRAQLVAGRLTVRLGVVEARRCRVHARAVFLHDAASDCTCGSEQGKERGGETCMHERG